MTGEGPCVEKKIGRCRRLLHLRDGVKDVQGEVKKAQDSSSVPSLDAAGDC